jgi:hypothetical protein
MTKTIEDLFLFLLPCSELLFIILFLIFYKRTKKETGLWLLGAYFLFDIGFNFAIINAAGSKWERILLTIYTLVEYCFFAWFLRLQIKSKEFRIGILISMIAFVVFSFVYFSFVEYISIDTVPIGVETILILLFSFYYLYEQMNEPSSLFIYNKYPFWVIAGIMLYLAGSLFIYMFAYQVDRSVLHQYWLLTNVVTIIRNILIIIAILIYVKQQKNPSPEKHLYPYLN